MHVAAQRGHAKVVKVLIDSGVDVNRQNKVNVPAIDVHGSVSTHRMASTSRGQMGVAPAHAAAFNDCANVLAVLRDNGADLNVTDEVKHTCYTSIIYHRWK